MSDYQYPELSPGIQVRTRSINAYFESKGNPKDSVELGFKVPGRKPDRPYFNFLYLGADHGAHSDKPPITIDRFLAQRGWGTVDDVVEALMELPEVAGIRHQLAKDKEDIIGGVLSALLSKHDK